ncbi:MAG: AAA family ATPase [Chloroflexi bacterium]|nr:AAA family ATPase [Chloroflexota bacterium]
MRQIAIYGKGGIGKSLVAANLAVALVEAGERVLQVGCSPKGDSTSFLHGGDLLDKNILEYTRVKGVSRETVRDCILEGYRGVLCAESGGPPPATGCAGRGVSMALEYLAKYKLIEEMATTFAIYDVLGDIVCGGFAQPMRGGFADQVYIVTSGELMSLYSANNICIAIEEMANTKTAKVKVGGFINNMRGVAQEEELVAEFSEMLHVPVLAHIPRSRIFQEAEGEGGTVMEKRPQSQEAEVFRALARRLREDPGAVVPTPTTIENIIQLLVKYQALN